MSATPPFSLPGPLAPAEGQGGAPSPGFVSEHDVRQSTAEPLGGDSQRGLPRRHRGTLCPCTRRRLLTATGQAGGAPQGTRSSASERPLEAEGLTGQGRVRGVWAPQAGLEEGARVPTQRGSPGAPQRQGLCAVNPGSGAGGCSRGCLFCDAGGGRGGAANPHPPLLFPSQARPCRIRLGPFPCLPAAPARGAVATVH